jgi:type II secretory pathway component PulC
VTSVAWLAVFLVAAPDPPPSPLAAVAKQVKKVDATHYVVPRQALDTMLAEMPRWPIRVTFEQQGEKVVALKLGGVAPGSLAARLGFREGDLLEAVNGLSVTGPAEALQAYAKTKDAEKITFAISRSGKPRAIEWRIVGAHAKDWDAPPKPRPPSPEQIEQAHARIAKMVKEIAKVDDRHFTMPRWTRDGLIVWHDVTPSWQILPVARDGKLIGMRLRGVTPGSLPAALGLVDDDVVVSVNGIGVSTPDDAVAVRGSFRTANPIRLSIERAATPFEIEVAVK